MRIELAERTNYPSDAFEMFTLTGYPNTESVQHHNLSGMKVKNPRDIPTRVKNNIVVSPEI